MQVKDIMTSGDIACCTPNATLKEAAELMNAHDCGAIPVLAGKRDRHLEGVITDRDITTRAVAKGFDPSEHTVSECMSRSVYTVRPEDSLEDCGRVMSEHQVRRVPVVDRDGVCCGMVAQADIARAADAEATAGVVSEVSRPSGGSRA